MRAKGTRDAAKQRGPGRGSRFAERAFVEPTNVSRAALQHQREALFEGLPLVLLVLEIVVVRVGVDLIGHVASSDLVRCKNRRRRVERS